MIQMMEKYSANLERTIQLNEEREKTDLLLYSMLPVYVTKIELIFKMS